MSYKNARAQKESQFNEAKAMEAQKKVLKNDYQTEIGDGEKEIIYELELTEPSHAQVEQTDLAEDKFLTDSQVQVMVAKKVEKRNTSGMKEKFIHIAELALIDTFNVRQNAPKE